MYGSFLLFDADFIHIVAITFTSLILTELLMVALTIRTWHYAMVLMELVSLLFYVLALIVFKDSFGEYSPSLSISLLPTTLITTFLEAGNLTFTRFPNLEFFVVFIFFLSCKIAPNCMFRPFVSTLC